MITCRVCEKSKPEEAFHKTPAGNPRKICKACQNAQRAVSKANNPNWQAQRRATLIRHKYGIEPEQYDKMLSNQSGACAICKRVVDYLLYVDHCHDTQRVRGLLCRECNLGIGYFKDNKETLADAIAYLERR